MNWAWKLKLKILNVNYIYFTKKVSDSHIKHGYRLILEYHMKEVWNKVQTTKGKFT